MIKILRFSLVLVSIILFSSCINKKELVEIKTYQYKYMATTGICNHIYFGNKIIPIEFHEKSNKKKLSLLNSLSPSILYPSSERIFLIGKLYNKIKKTPNSPYMAVSEEYQEFELFHWYILCPFKEYTNIGLLEDPKIIERTKLQPNDIGLGNVGQMLININEYQKEE